MSSTRDRWIFAATLMVAFLSCVGIALPYPILAPLFMGGEVNGLNSFAGISPELLLGIALAIYPFGIFIGGSFIGSLSDTYGRKKVLQLTLLISVAGYIASAIAIVQEQYLLFIIARFFTGLCEGNVSIARAIALDLAKTIDKTRAISVLNAAIFAGWLMGPLVGGVLAMYGSHVAFNAAAVAILACSLLVQLAIKETTKATATRPFHWKDAISQNSLRLLSQKPIRLVFYIQLFFTLGLNAFYEFYPVWLVTDRNFTPEQIGYTTAGMTLFMTLASLIIVTRLKNKFGQPASMLTALFALSTLVLLLPVTWDFAMQAVFALMGISIAVMNGNFSGYITDIHEDVGHGAMMGLLTTTFCLSNTIIALLGSWMLHFNSNAPLLSTCGFVVIAIWFLYKLVAQQKAEQPAQLAKAE